MGTLESAEAELDEISISKSARPPIPRPEALREPEPWTRQRHKQHWGRFRRQRAGGVGNGAHTGALLGTLGAVII